MQPDSADHAHAGEDNWAALLECAAARRGGAGLTGSTAELFGPVLDAIAAGNCVVAHLGQSLDGHIAMPDGRSQYVTGREDAAHNHRLRALCDAVVVGAGTAQADDPQLTVRHVPGDNPVRVVIDRTRRLDPSLGLFCDGAAPTLLVCSEQAARGAQRHGDAEIVTVAPDANGLLPVRRIAAALADRGLHALFVEGGGATVSHFIEAGLIDRLHITIAPILLGDGRPVLTLPAIERIDAARRVAMRPFPIGDDILYDCVFDGDG